MGWKKFDRYPYARRPFLEVLSMDWILPIFLVLLPIGVIGALIVSCSAEDNYKRRVGNMMLGIRYCETLCKNSGAAKSWAIEAPNHAINCACQE